MPVSAPRRTSPGGAPAPSIPPVRGRVLVVHDPHRLVLRRALRIAAVVPIVFAISASAWTARRWPPSLPSGSFAMLGLTDLGGPFWRRAAGYAGITVAGGALIAVGTAASRNVLAAALPMAVVGFTVTLISVFGGYLAQSGTALTLAFVLAVTIQADTVAIGERLAGWAVAGLASITRRRPSCGRQRERRVLSAQARRRLPIPWLRCCGRPPRARDGRASYAIHGGPRCGRRAPPRTARHPLPAGRADRHDGAFLYLVDALSWLTDLCRSPSRRGGYPAGEGAELLLGHRGRARHVRRGPPRWGVTGSRPLRHPAPDAELDDLCREIGAHLDGGWPAEQVGRAGATGVVTPRVRVPCPPLTSTPRSPWVASTTTAPTTRRCSRRQPAPRYLARHSTIVRAPRAPTRRCSATPCASAWASARRSGSRSPGTCPGAFWVGLGMLTASARMAGTGFTVVQAMAGTSRSWPEACIVSIGDNRPLLGSGPPGGHLPRRVCAVRGGLCGDRAGVVTVFVVVLFNLEQPAGWKTGEARWSTSPSAGHQPSRRVDLLAAGQRRRLRTASMGRGNRGRRRPGPRRVRGLAAVVRRRAGHRRSAGRRRPGSGTAGPHRLPGGARHEAELSDHACGWQRGRAVHLSRDRHRHHHPGMATAGWMSAAGPPSDSGRRRRWPIGGPARPVPSCQPRRPQPAVLDCFRSLHDHGRARVHEGPRLISAQAWLRSIDDLAVHLAALAIPIPAPWPRGRGRPEVAEADTEIRAGHDRVAVERDGAQLVDGRHERDEVHVRRVERDHHAAVTLLEPPHRGRAEPQCRAGDRATSACRPAAGARARRCGPPCRSAARARRRPAADAS